MLPCLSSEFHLLFPGAPLRALSFGQKRHQVDRKRVHGSEKEKHIVGIRKPTISLYLEFHK